MKKLLILIIVFALVCAIGGIMYFSGGDDGEITEIPIESVKGITTEEAEKLCYSVMGDKDEETGNIFSFGVSGAVRKGRKQYYTVRASWLVNSSHLSYIGDFFVSADGKELYSGIALPDEYEMTERIWKK